MDIWVVECEKFSDNDVSIRLYEDVQDACIEASNIARDEMTTYGLDDPDHSSHLEWKRLIEAINNKDYHLTLDVYNDWNSDLDYENRFSITVYSKKLITSLQESRNPNVTVVKAKSSSKPDVPCKQCGRKVNEAEDVCWYCGVSNPAIS